MGLSNRLLYFFLVPLAGAPPLLSSHLVPPSAAAPRHAAHAGFTLGEDKAGRIVVTSLRDGQAGGGPIAVGDQLRAVDGHAVRRLGVARHMIDDPDHCDIPLSLAHGAVRYEARARRCGK
ncbi:MULTISPECIES: hypothetical protein [Sphingobium]|uniref:hypothetical protein n=1 Tax=Sphingobium TaxID=165695 RepID=UPI0015EBD7D9|nr:MULTISPECIES: hypothetical protein [Sphingobium]MCW2361666.1 hypothetical protein [Sphingobium sp. B10D3B]MCW2401655.1 hypothetical protein [Sphingobium sp. B10D7B]MCW2408635.1 hypothetical protein [Sphingobium xanthum]